MARTTEDLVQELLGQQAIQIAMLKAKAEALTEENARLKAAAAAEAAAK